MLLAVDPGRDKVGWAAGTDRGELIGSGILLGKSAPAGLKALLAGGPRPADCTVNEGSWPAERPRAVLLGNGTWSDKFRELLLGLGASPVLVDEKNTTLQARSLYWGIHPPRSWRRLIPLSLQTPPRPLDDLAALCILRRYLQSGSKQSVQSSCEGD